MLNLQERLSAPWASSKPHRKLDFWNLVVKFANPHVSYFDELESINSFFFRLQSHKLLPNKHARLDDWRRPIEAWSTHDGKGSTKD